MLNKRMLIAVSIFAFTLASQTQTTAWSHSGTPARPASATQRERNVIWHDPGNIQSLDLGSGEGGPAAAPKPPFTFVSEDKTGTNPKILVSDAQGRQWGVKWGEEVNSEVFAARLVWAVGYFVQPEHFVAQGTILKVGTLGRAEKYVSADGRFSDARFELRDKTIVRLSDEQSWSWDENPFVGTKELNGLKVMLMLLSNWDSKDKHQAGKGSNTKILVVKARTGTERRYVVSDWGGTMGKWGNFLKRGKWDCDGYESQNADLVKEVRNGQVEWGYSGQHTGLIRDDISVAHVQWLLGYLGKISDAQIRAALVSSGASASDVSCFTRSVRARITRLQAIR